MLRYYSSIFAAILVIFSVLQLVASFFAIVFAINKNAYSGYLIFGGLLVSSAFWYAMSYLVEAAYIYIRKNTEDED